MRILQRNNETSKELHRGHGGTHTEGTEKKKGL
jgi:hypothetical protein